MFGVANTAYLFWQANRGFVRAFSVPSLNNGLICLKGDRGPRRIRYLDTAIRRSTLKLGRRGNVFFAAI
jgi:hypothetical protein